MLRNILALMPCGKPQVARFVHLVELPRWLPERVNFTNLEHCGGRPGRQMFSRLRRTFRTALCP